MEGNRYSEQLKQLMEMIVAGVSKEDILESGKALKINLSRDFVEAQRIIGLLDGIISQFAQNESWPMGIWLHPQQQPQQSIVIRGTPFGQGQVTLQTSPLQRATTANPNRRILELARRYAVNGFVHTSEISKQLRIEGDLRPERNMAKKVGNVLVRNGWDWVETGKYKLVQTKNREGELSEKK